MTQTAFTSDLHEQIRFLQERVKTLEALQKRKRGETEKNLKKIINLEDHAIIIIDQQANICKLNFMALRLAGQLRTSLGNAHLIGKNIKYFFNEQFYLSEREIRQIIDAGLPMEKEIEVNNYRLSLIFFKVDEKIGLLVKTIQDFSQAHKTAVLAHDMNNLLTCFEYRIDSIFNVLQKYPFILNFVANHFEQLRSLLDQVKKLTNGLLGSGQNSFIKNDLNSIIKKTCDLMNTEIELRFQTERANIYGNELQLMQIISNLILNAKQAISAQGKITVATQPITLTADTPMSSGIAVKGNYIALIVTDSGSGIAPENIDKIFKPFFTTKGEGCGLGLASVHKLVENHQAHISLQSQVGQGTTFKVFFPAAKQ